MQKIYQIVTKRNLIHKFDSRRMETDVAVLSRGCKRHAERNGMVWYGMVYGMVEFNVPLDTIQVISETGGGGAEQRCASLIQ